MNHVNREDVKHRPEVHVAGLCFKKDNGEIRVLISRRSPTRELFPGLYEGCGGQLQEGEMFAEGVKRHFKDEMGIEVKVWESAYTIYGIQRESRLTIPGICYLCAYVSGKARSPNHTEHRWVTEDELRQMSEGEFIPSMKRKILRSFEAVNLGISWE